MFCIYRVYLVDAVIQENVNVMQIEVGIGTGIGIGSGNVIGTVTMIAIEKGTENAIDAIAHRSIVIEVLRFRQIRIGSFRHFLDLRANI